MSLESWMRNNPFSPNNNLSLTKRVDTCAQTTTLKPEINLCKTTLMSWTFNSDIRAQIIHRSKMNIWPNTQQLSACLCVCVSVCKSINKKKPIFLERLLNIYQVAHFDVLQLWLDAGGPGCAAGAVPSGCEDGSGTVKNSKQTSVITNQTPWSRKAACWALTLGTHTCRWERQGSGRESLGSFLLQASSGWAGPGLKDEAETQGN